MQAVILAGGKGTRLAKALGMDIPKPMAPVLGVPLLQRTVESLRDQGIKDILILVHHRADVVRDHFGDGGKFGVRLRCIRSGLPVYPVLPLFARLFSGRAGENLPLPRLVGCPRIRPEHLGHPLGSMQ